MRSDVTTILEKYIEGKDQDNFKILEDIYTEDAKVIFQIRTPAITFPSEIVGRINIAQVLSKDFNRKYDCIKTYYLGLKDKERNALNVSEQEWLVAMRETASCCTRIGCGLYNWTFERTRENKIKIKEHEIIIAEMLDLPDRPLPYLTSFQSLLPYPWTNRETVLKVASRYNEMQKITDFLMCRESRA